MGKRTAKMESERLPSGTQVKVYGISHEDVNGDGKTATVYFKVWQVVKYYPHFILMQDKRGIRECFTYWELRRRLRPPRRVLKSTGEAKWVWE